MPKAESSRQSRRQHLVKLAREDPLMFLEAAVDVDVQPNDIDDQPQAWADIINDTLPALSDRLKRRMQATHVARVALHIQAEQQRLAPLTPREYANDPKNWIVVTSSENDPATLHGADGFCNRCDDALDEWQGICVGCNKMEESWRSITGTGPYRLYARLLGTRAYACYRCMRRLHKTKRITMRYLDEHLQC